MAAITGIVSTGRIIPLPSSTPGGLVGEVWRVPASTAGDTQTITSLLLRQIVAILGPVSFTALAGANQAALITSVTVAASNFVDILVIGYENL
jgi:hypothetical protein